MYNNNFNKERENKSNLTVKENVNNTFLRTLGISYDEFDEMDFEEQQRIIKKYNKKNPKSKGKNNVVMVGSGEHSIFIKVKPGEKVMVGSGEHSIFVEAGITPEYEKRILDDKLDNLMYSKPLTLFKKLTRRNKR